MTIIEKLGAATPDELKTVGDVWKVYELAGLPRPHIGNEAFEQGEKLKKIIDDKNEMLDALIDIRKFMDRLPSEWFSEHRACNIESIIQKATGSPWEEIKILDAMSDEEINMDNKKEKLEYSGEEYGTPLIEEDSVMKKQNEVKCEHRIPFDQRCPVCGGRIKTMYKPDKQYHCRGACGLIVRVQDEDNEWDEKIKTMISEYEVLKRADLIVKELEKMFPNWMKYRDILGCISDYKSATARHEEEIERLRKELKLYKGFVV